MFCYQCEQTSKGTGCTVVGVCGKDERTAALQDLLIHAAKGLGQVAWAARQDGHQSEEVDLLVMEALFTTVTNVSFDEERVVETVRQVVSLRDVVAAETGHLGLGGAAALVLDEDIDGLVAQGVAMGIQARMEDKGEVIVGLYELIMYGLKGMAAYADHAWILGHSDQGVRDFFIECLAWTTEDHTVDELVAMALRVGEVNITVMAMLDAANTGAYGDPVPTVVNLAPVEGKAILVSGHDLKDLYALLEQTEGKGVNIYTHGEMMPANAYPELKKFPHFVGHYGTAWQNQAREFDAFPGAILMTTNCIQRPRKSYKARIFTTGLVSWPGVEHVSGHDFTPVIEAALEAPGFAETLPPKTTTVGFGHKTVLGVADVVIDAVKSGAIKHFFLIGGCDGAKTGRNYYSDLAQSTPDDTVILTLGCGKFRINDHDYGTVGGLPRLLDMGQCNDAYSAVVVAQALAEAFDTDINSLPLDLVLSWYEQKAVVILLSLLHLGVQGIRIGPTVPAFLTPPVVQVLVDNFQLTPVGDAREDLAAMLG